MGFAGPGRPLGGRVGLWLLWLAMVAALPLAALVAWQASLRGLSLALVSTLGVALFLGVRTARADRLGWQREVFYRSLLESAPIGIAVARGPENRLAMVNPVYRRIIGQTPAPIEGRRLREVFPEATAQAAEGYIAEARRTGHRVRIHEIPVVTDQPPQTDYWDVDYVPLAAAEDGQAGDVLMLAVPVSEKVHARHEVEALAREAEGRAAQLQAAHENLLAILDRLPDGVMVVDTVQRVVISNQTTRLYVGEEVTGKTLAELRDTHSFAMPDGRPFPPGQAPIERSLRGETVAGVEARILHPDGHVIDLLVSAAPLYDAEGHISAAVIALTNITAKKQIEAERERLLAQVERARRELHTIIDQLPDGVAVIDSSLRITLANGALHSLLGRDITGMSLSDLDREFQLLSPAGQPLPPEARPVQRLQRGEPVSGSELRIQRPDGSAVDLLLGMTPLYDQEVTSTIIFTLTDITARRQAERERERLLAEVQAARENLRNILEHLPAGVLVTDTELCITLANDVVRQYLGPDLIGKTEAEITQGTRFETPDGQPVSTDRMPLQTALRGESAVGVELRVRQPGGGVIDLLSSATALRDGQGRITGAALISTDITPQKQAQAERERLLAEAEGARRELRTIIDQLPDSVLVVDSIGRIIMFNNVVQRYAERDLSGMSVADAERMYDFRQADGQEFPPGETPLQRALRGQTVIGVEASVRLPDGRRADLLKSAVPVFGPDGTVHEVAAVITEVTALKELDRAKDQFISTAAHELRTPLTALKGHTQVLLRHAQRAGWAKADQDSLHTIDSQVDRLNDLIGRLLDVSRIRLGRLQVSRKPTDIVNLATQVADELQVTTQVHHIRVQAEAHRIVGNWDPAALRQVLNNLIGNAIKYAVPGPIDVRLWQEDGQALVSVTDYGPGIPPEQQAKIFEAFRPGPAEQYRKADGLGLGLYITRGIVEAHGGRIGLESQVGVGTTFTFSLPLNGQA